MNLRLHFFTGNWFAARHALWEGKYLQCNVIEYDTRKIVLWPCRRFQKYRLRSHPIVLQSTKLVLQSSVFSLLQPGLARALYNYLATILKQVCFKTKNKATIPQLHGFNSMLATAIAYHRVCSIELQYTSWSQMLALLLQTRRISSDRTIHLTCHNVRSCPTPIRQLVVVCLSSLPKFKFAMWRL